MEDYNNYDIISPNELKIDPFEQPHSFSEMTAG